MKKYSEDMIREAVDIAVGDDGFRSNEVRRIGGTSSSRII